MSRHMFRQQTICLMVFALMLVACAPRATTTPVPPPPSPTAVPPTATEESPSPTTILLSSPTARRDTPTPSRVQVQRPSLGKPEEEVSQAQVFVFQETLSMRPPFYKGSMPLRFIAGKIQVGANQQVTLYQDFGQWRNAFIYEDPRNKFLGVADGARTTSPSGQLLAEAKLARIIQGQGIEIEEFHYASNGEVRFYCKSQIDFTTGFKIVETDVKGEKESDYYFIWPVR